MTGIIFLTVIAFGVAAFLGAPWLPTRKKETEAALDLLNLRSGQKVIDLGSGAGGFLIAAARRKILAEGYEINPVLWLISWIRLWPYRKYAKVTLGNFWNKSLSECDGVYVFLIEHYMGKLDRKFKAELKKGAKAVSFVFKIPSQKPINQQDGLFLYKY